MFVVLLGVQRPFYAADVLATLLDVLRNLPRARLRRAFTEDFGEALGRPTRGRMGRETAG